MEFKNLEELFVGNVYTFGYYKIQGCLVFISSISGDNIVSSLHYHFETNRFLLIKKYKSEKYHIDFFDRIDETDILYSSNNASIDTVIEVAECHQKDHSKFLSYDPINDAYIITSVFAYKRFESVFRKNTWSDR
jgi:hypothetical protein